MKKAKNFTNLFLLLLLIGLTLINLNVMMNASSSCSGNIQYCVDWVWKYFCNPKCLARQSECAAIWFNYWYCWGGVCFQNFDYECLDGWGETNVDCPNPKNYCPIK